ncbi:MAG: hypothetical protein JO097_01825 [Acidobacteriaceae bacterium]|nr:hypothetical protein [Acidobacteriaceae bacterium]MBV9296095.1 hypothetical protein [Acidobacteriaceae bacterium]MBV9766611.1 hypothetical protein [Acidobacteriaceae bacterium]
MKLLIFSALLVFGGTACLADDLGIQGAVQVGSNYIDFGQSLTGGPYTPAPGTGIFQVTSVGAGSIFATGGVTTGELGNITSLNGSPYPFVFMAFTGAGGSGDSLNATSIPNGTVGPFHLKNTSQGAEALFEVLGYIGSNTAQTFTAEFAIGFSGLTVDQLFSHLPVDGHFCANVDASGTPSACDPFPTSSSVPEPSYTAVVFAGLLAAVVACRLRKGGNRPSVKSAQA